MSLMISLRSRIPAWIASTQTFLKTPANLLAIAAIIATVVVPVVDKLVKTEGELRAKLTSLTDATNTVIASNDGALAAGPGATGPDSQRYSIALAKRANDVHRAVSIADSMLADAYPSVLLALSRELCHDNDAKHAERFTSEVLRRGRSSREEVRPKLQELAEANVIMASCVAVRGSQYSSLTEKEKEELEARMRAALATYDSSVGRAAAMDRVGIHLTWMSMEQALGDRVEAQNHLRAANDLAKKIDHPEPWLLRQLASMQPPASASTTSSEAPKPVGPSFSGGATYDVAFPDVKTSWATLILEGGTLHDKDFVGTLLVYRDGNLIDSYQLQRTSYHDVSPEFRTFQNWR